MIEAYAFFAMFAIQTVAVSVLYPTWFIRYVRGQGVAIPPERLAQRYPDTDARLAQERFLSQYRALNTVIAVLGALLLDWLFGYMQRPDWRDGPVEAVITVYFLVQVLVP